MKILLAKVIDDKTRDPLKSLGFPEQPKDSKKKLSRVRYSHTTKEWISERLASDYDGTLVDRVEV